MGEFIIVLILLIIILFLIRWYNKDKKKIKIKYGYVQSLVSNIYRISFHLFFLYLIFKDIEEHKYIKYETGTDWAIVYFIFFFGPLYIDFSILGIRDIYLYYKDEEMERTKKRKIMHYMNIISFIVLFIFVILILCEFFIHKS